MHIVERSFINHSVDEVWPVLVSSDLFAQWNTHVKSMNIQGPFLEGAQFWTTYSWKGNDSQCRTTVLRVVAPELIVLQHSEFQSAQLPAGMIAEERIQVRKKGSGTEVRKDIRVRGGGEPWIVSVLAWWVTRFGTRSEPDPLPPLVENVLNRKLNSNMFSA